MTYVFEQFEKTLKGFVEQCTFDKTLCIPVFEKKNTDNPFGDFSAFLTNRKYKKGKTVTLTTVHLMFFMHSICIHLFQEIKGMEVCSRTENWSLIVDSIKVDCNRMILKLNREHTNRTGLEFVSRTASEYGTNSYYRNKVFVIKQEVEDKIGLTDLRTALSSQLIKNLIISGSGFVQEDKIEPDFVELVKVGRKCFGKNSVTIGAVKISGNHLSKVAFLCRRLPLRMNDINELGEHKEDNIDNIQCLVNAAICFDLLSTKVDRPVILDVCSEPMTVRERSTKGATFVLYNYARICAILKQFQNRVDQKIYDPLPQITETHTELLTQKEEWSLMFDYILEWPEVVHTCQNLSLLKLHNVCNFMSSLSLCFSAFYRRCRILTDPLPQLLPLMYARIHLLLALKQVFQNGFRLLSIEAPSHM